MTQAATHRAPERLDAGPPPGAPEAFLRALGRLEGHWTEGTRAYARGTGPDGRPRFGRTGTDPGDVAALAAEVAVREALVTGTALRAPRVVAAGPGWLVDEAVAPVPLAGPEAVDAVLAAVGALLERDPATWPPAAGGAAAPPEPRRRTAAARAARLARLARAPLPLRAALAARRALREPDGLPLRPAHGDLQPGNLLWTAEGRLWVVDWELADVLPAGTDLLQLWPLLEHAEDRERLWRGTVALVGARHEAALRRRREALLVRTAEGLVTARDPLDRDPALAARVLALSDAAAR